MQRDALRRGLEKVRHLRLSQPNRALLKPALDAGLTVLRLVENEAGLGLWFGGSHIFFGA